MGREGMTGHERFTRMFERRPADRIPIIDLAKELGSQA